LDVEGDFRSRSWRRRGRSDLLGAQGLDLLHKVSEEHRDYRKIEDTHGYSPKEDQDFAGDRDVVIVCHFEDRVDAREVEPTSLVSESQSSESEG